MFLLEWQEIPLHAEIGVLAIYSVIISVVVMMVMMVMVVGK